MLKATPKYLRLASVIACMLLLMQPATAQEKPSEEQPKKAQEKAPKPVIVYQLDFAVDELLEGKRINTRNFTMLLKEGESNKVRMGTRLPVSGRGPELKYTDVGLKFDCSLQERDNLIVLDFKLDLNDFALPEETGRTTSQPLIRNVQAEIETAIPPDKPTVIGIFDDSANKRRYELRATVVKVK